MASEKILISVLFNNYNYAKFIGQAIESVLCQSYADFELLIIDDGSTDNSRDVINSFSDRRIRKIFKSNGGQASAFNVGFQESKGEIIAFLDSDDWWTPSKLDRIIQWDTFLKGNYSMLQHGMDVWDNGRTYPFKPAMFTGDLFTHTMKNGDMGYMPTSALCVRKSVLEKVFPVPEEFRIAADAYLTRTCYTFGPAYFIPDRLGYYRKHQNAVLGNNTFDLRNFQGDLLYPNLNRFYSCHNHDFRFDTKPLTSRSPAPPAKGKQLTNQLVFRQFLMSRLAEIFGKYQTVAVFGAGFHTGWFERMTAGFGREKIVAVLDDNVRQGASFWGREVLSASKWDCKKADAIILSTDCHQKAMKQRCASLFGDGIPLIDIYEGLTPGPYDKS